LARKCEITVNDLSDAADETVSPSVVFRLSLMLRENVKTWTTFWIVVLHFIVPDFIEAELLINLKNTEKYLSKTITG